MTTEEKVDLEAEVQEEYGLVPALQAVELPRSTWYFHQTEKVSYQAKYAHLHPLLEKIARRHPEYGYRRTTKELRNTFRKIINHKVGQRLHRLWELALLWTTRVPRPSAIRQIIKGARGKANLIVDLDPIDLIQVDYTDSRNSATPTAARKPT
jgi:hypothetical protein